MICLKITTTRPRRTTKLNQKPNANFWSTQLPNVLEEPLPSPPPQDPGPADIGGLVLQHLTLEIIPTWDGTFPKKGGSAGQLLSVRPKNWLLCWVREEQWRAAKYPSWSEIVIPPAPGSVIEPLTQWRQDWLQPWHPWLQLTRECNGWDCTQWCMTNP